MTSYVYRPLRNGEIRLFNLSLGSLDDPLVGRLTHHSVDAGVPSYTALSYVWGNAISHVPARILPNASKCITFNLECALRHLRSLDSEILLWVDALCINQDDNAEKAQQVGLMRDIYAMASEVVAFLGNERCKLSGATKLASLNAEDRAVTGSGSGPCLTDFLDWARTKDQDSVWHGLFSVLCSSWFSRLWIIQEALVARKLSFRCGTESVSVQALAGLVSEIPHTVSPSLRGNSAEQEAWKYMLNSIGLIRKIASRNLVGAHTRHKADLLELLWNYRGHKASKARDHLFALLGLANVPYNTLLSPDYTSNLEVVIYRYARFFVEFDKDPIRLLYSARGISNDDRFPSWIPNWILDEEEPGRSCHIACRFLTPAKRFYSAALSTPPSMRIGKTDNVVIVTGSIFSYLTVLGDSHWEEVDQEDNHVQRCLAYIQESDHFVHKLSTYPTGEELEDVKIRLLVGNRAWNPGLSYTYLEDDYVRQYKNFRQNFEHTRKPQQRLIALFDAAKNKEKTIGYINALLNMTDVRLCRTKNGYLGLGPPGAQTGDAVCIINGSCVPFVLRSSPDVKGSFQLVGKCYIHGIMEGEAMQIKDLVQKQISLV
ncbi:hypothetical protein EPUS_00167 [Endocarpon pusillum Z07020]|uniref:Heterokaryon incompatibility domain-containing protein n=1 Tax=Endocarpon pusillum (strain Z07020 / HMAS-L-300199) TaxID=1263415 RepID=U1I0H6_ENDPU|nr:uncharacterized protein EPUS_00167 [Endocarpon pusillum Z07020]ERF75374.1 hypothetical protein EPUS_00167 [Endocarpon pusillum Z07020]